MKPSSGSCSRVFCALRIGGVDPRIGAQAAIRQRVLRLARLLVRIRIAQLRRQHAALFEDTKRISRWPISKRGSGNSSGKRPSVCVSLGRDLARAQQRERLPVRAVVLAEERILEMKRAIIIGGRGPEHRAMIHHAVIDLIHNVAVRGTLLFGLGAMAQPAGTASATRRSPGLTN